ncbi:MAG TPA: hypothetical protein VIJ01_15575 [Candidatus Angelobacter sp.]
MPCHHFDDVVHALIATLRMDAVVLPEFSRNRFQQSQVGLSQYVKVGQRLPWIAPRIVKSSGPQVLIVSLNGNGIVRQYLAETPGNGQFGISEMGYDFSDRPFVRGRALHQLLAGLPFQQRRDFARRGLLQAQRVFAVGVT